MERGDIYFVDLDPTARREQRGHRPIIVISPNAFNQLGVQLVAPITSGGAFARHRGFAVELSGTKTTGVILCNQVRTIDIKARNGRFIEPAPAPIVDDMLAKISTLLE